MRFFKSIKQNEIKQSKEEIQQKVTSKDLHEQHKKAMNRYQRHLKEYDEEQTEEKYKELIETHTELKELEKKLQELGPISNEITDDDFDIKHEDINEPVQNEGKIPEDLQTKIEIAEEIFKQVEEKETTAFVNDFISSPEPENIEEPMIHENNSNTEPQEEMITGDDGITRPKSMHDQIESNKCLFCDEKFGFVQDWNVHMMREHPEQLIEYNKQNIDKLQSEYKTENNLPENLHDTEKIVDDIFEEAIQKSTIKSEDPDLEAIHQLMDIHKIDTKEKYDNMMNEIEKNSPYAIQNIEDIQKTTHEIQSEPDPLKEIAERLKIMKESSIVNLPEIIIKPKKKFDLSGIFQKKKFSKLKGIEAYCNICKHTVQQHEYQGKSEGCVKCGCLKTVQDILEINEIDLKYGEKKEIVDNGITCVCGHSQLTHKDHSKFCEVEECHCVRFRDK